MNRTLITFLTFLLLPLLSIAQQTTKGNSVVVPPVSFSNGSPVYSFRFDDAPLGQHIDGQKEGDQRSRSFTFSAWVNIKDGRNGYLMGMGITSLASSYNAFLVQYTNNKLSFIGRNVLTEDTYPQNVAGSETKDPGTPENEWVFVSVVADKENKTVTLYKNCVAISSFATWESIYMNTTSGCFFIADRGSSVAISEVQLWDRALTVDELKETYNFTATTAPEGLTAWYKPEELAEGSDSELRNLGTEGTTTAAVLYGNTRYTFEGLSFLSPAPQTVNLTGEGRELKTVAVEAIQPAITNSSFTITGENDRTVTDNAILYEKLNINPSLAPGLKLLSVAVTNTDEGTTTSLLPEELPFFAESNISVALRLNDLLNLTFEGEHCTLQATIDGETSEVTKSGLMVNNGSDIELTILPEKGYLLEAATINGEDATELFTTLSHTISSITDDHHITVKCVIPHYNITVINPEVADGEDEMTTVFGELQTPDFNTHPDYISGEPLEVIEGTDLVLCILPAEPIGDTVHRLAAVTDNGTDITSLLDEQEDGSYTYPISDIHAHHTFVITQTELLGSIAGIDAESEKALHYANHTLSTALPAMIEVTDIYGRTIARTYGCTLDTYALIPGVYVAKAATASGVCVLKFVK